MRVRKNLGRTSRAARLESLERRCLLAASATFAVEMLAVEVDQVLGYRLADLDGDGRLDLAVRRSDEIAWFDRPDDAETFRHRQSLALAANHFELVDLDGDQRLDLVVGETRQGVYWYRNGGLAGFETDRRQLVAIAETGAFVAADIDQDGDQDLLIPLAHGAILHAENADGLGTVQLRDLIFGQVAELPQIAVADLNDDAAPDLLIATSAGVAWHANIGGRLNADGSRQEISSDAGSSPQLADLDGDGDVDLVLRRATSDGGELVWFENEQGAFPQAHLIRSELSGEQRAIAFTGDVDHDGRADVVSLHTTDASQQSELRVSSPSGLGGAWRVTPLAGSDVHLVGLGDADGDGHLDVLALRADGRLVTYDFRIIGDVNRDGAFDSSDLVEVQQFGHYEDDAEGNSTYGQGDWNGDREFDSSDLVLAFQVGTYEQDSSPRMFFSRADVPQMRAKLANPTRRAQFDREIQLALDTVHLDYSDPNLYEQDKARQGQRYAFLTLMLESDDPRRAVFAHKAREVLANANEGSWGAFTRFPAHRATFDLSTSPEPWYSGGVLMDLTLTYDWLIGAGELNGVARHDARFRILRMAQIEHILQKTPYDEFDHSKYPIRLSNYAFRSVSGVGLVALAFPDQRGLISDPYDRMPLADQAEFDTSQALDWVLGELFDEITTSSKNNPANGQSLVEHFITPDGVIRESFYYELDTYSLLMPFLAALDRLRGMDYISSNGLSDGRIARTFDTNFKVMLPNGNRPLMGDAYSGNYYFWHEVAAPYTDNPAAHYQASYHTLNVGISMAYYNDTTPRAWPEYRTEFLPESGLAVFRDKWGPDATYLMLVAQDDPVMGHDQADQGDISLFAHGVPLVIETGYGSAYRRDPDARVRGGKEDWINSALGHSTVTLNSVYTVETTPDLNLWSGGVTPSVALSYTQVPDPATIENTLAAAQIDYAEAHVTYTDERAKLERAVVFPRHRYFILEDTLTAEASHHYGWQLHLSKTETSRFRVVDDHYVFTTPNVRRENVSLAIHMLDEQGRNVNVYDNGPTNRDGYLFPKNTYDHTYILADKQAEDIRFVTLLDPYQDDADKLQVETLVADRVWKVVHSPTSYDLILSQPEAGEIEFGEIRTDAKFLVASIDRGAAQDQVISLLARGGSQLQVGYDQQQMYPLAAGALFHREFQVDG
jgi:hypothetical protein